MTTDINFDNNSNIDAPSSEDFNFKGFPYVISVLGQDYKPSNNEDSIKIKKIKEKIRDSIDKIAEKCTSGWCWKKSVIPLFILFDSKNTFIKNLFATEKPEESFNSKRKDRHIVLYTVDSDIDGHIYIQRYNDTNKDFDPKFDDQEANKKRSNEQQRQLNEYIVQHSHLSIIFNDKLLDTEADINNEPDDSLIWAIRYKLEGYPGSLYQQEQSEKITYPAIGPILRIVKDNQNKDDINTYFYPSREPITTQEGHKPRKSNQDYIKKCKIGNNEDFVKIPEIINNIDILKEINKECLNKPLPKGDFSIEDLSIQTNAQNIVKDSEFKDLIKQDNDRLKSLIKCTTFFQGIAFSFKEKTYKLTRRFCCVFLILFMCNAFLIYLNNICIRSLGVNTVQLTCNLFDSNSIVDCIVNNDFVNNYMINTRISNKNIIDKIKQFKSNNSVKVFTILGLFCINGIILIVSIGFICYYVYKYWCNSYPRKYHIFQTLADCLRIQTYWKYAGMHDSVNNNFRSHQIPGVDWLLISLNGLILTIQEQSVEEKDSTDGKLKEKYLDYKIKHIDKIWLEDRIDNEFKNELNKSEYAKAWESLKHLSKTLVILWYFILLFLIFLFTGYAILHNWWITIGIFFLSLIPIHSLIMWIIDNYLISNNKTNEYFHNKFLNNIIICILILFGCLAGFFELSRLSSLCSAAQKSFSCSWVDSLRSFAEEFRLIIQIFLAFILVAFLYLRMQMFSKERKRINQLYSSFNVADYFIDFLSTADEKTIQNLELKENKSLEEIINNNYRMISEMPDNPFNEEKINSIINSIDNIIQKTQNSNIDTNMKIASNSNASKESRGVFGSLWEWFFPSSNTKNSKSEVHTQNSVDTSIQDKNKKIISELKNIKTELGNIKSRWEQRNIFATKAKAQKQQNDKEIDKIKKMVLFQRVLLELGQEVLAKRADWLLAVTDRDLQTPK